MTGAPRRYDMARIVAVYQRARWAGDARPVRTTMDEVRCSRATVQRAVADAARRGVLDVPGSHHPRRVRWLSGSPGSWIACASCRKPWPCPNWKEREHG